MTVTVRPATADDKERCLEMIGLLRGEPVGAGSPEAFDTLLTRERGTVWVAEDDADGVLGIATVSYNVAIRYGGEYCQLEELYVDTRARGKNVGGLLLERVIGGAKERGCGEIGVYLLDWTKHNKPFYEKYGFVSVGDEMRQQLP